MKTASLVKEKNRIVSNTIWSWVASITNLFFSVCLIKLLLLEFGDVGFGIIGVVTGLVALLSTTDFGIRPAVSRELAAATVANDDYVQFNQVFNTSFVASFVLSLLVLGIVVPFTPFWYWLLGIGGENESVANILFWIFLVPTTIISFFEIPFRSVLIAKHRFEVLSQIQMVSTTVSGGVIIGMMVCTEVSMLVWAITMVATKFLTFSVFAFSAFKIQPKIKISLHFISLSTIRELLGYGSQMYILNFAMQLNSRIDALLISSVLGPGMVSVYRPGNSLVNKSRSITRGFSRQLNPLASIADAQSNQKKLSEITIKGTRASVFLATPVFLVLGVFSFPIISIWLASELQPVQLKTAAMVLFLWSVIDFSSAFTSAMFTVLKATKTLRFSIAISVVELMLNVPLSILLLKYTELGVVGALLPTLVFSLMRRFAIANYALRTLKIKNRVFLKDALLGPIIAAVVGTLVASATVFFWPPESIVFLAFFSSTSIACWFGVSFFFVLSLEEKEKINLLFNKLSSKVQRMTKSKS